MAERWMLRPGRVEWRHVEGEIVALDVEASEYLAVNAVGALLWEQLAAGATAAELEAELQARFGIDQASGQRRGRLPRPAPDPGRPRLRVTAENGDG